MDIGTVYGAKAEGAQKVAPPSLLTAVAGLPSWHLVEPEPT
jgi:hypothetical protein